MFIEVTELLRCPRDHDESYVVCVPIEMQERRVIRGVIGCPVCHTEYAIADGVVYFASSFPPPHAAAAAVYDASALAAFLSLAGKGGYIALAGRAARHAAELAEQLPGVHIVAVNPPHDAARPATISVLIAPQGLPLKTHSVRAVALGADTAGAIWVADAVRVLLPGLRIVVEDDTAEPAQVEVLARAGGVLVGEKRAR